MDFLANRWINLNDSWIKPDIDTNIHICVETGYQRSFYIHRVIANCGTFMGSKALLCEIQQGTFST